MRFLATPALSPANMTMRAIRGTPSRPLGRGIEPEPIAPIKDVPIPDPSPGDVLVKVAYASVNR